nr:MAG TPA: protein of unknown function (DUF5463) [Caudoviricetes sp.]
MVNINSQHISVYFSKLFLLLCCVLCTIMNAHERICYENRIVCKTL